MQAIQIKSNEVLEGIMHGYMHKGAIDDRHLHSAPDVIYISTSDRAADFEVRGILRKNTVPNNFYACGYSSVLQRVRGRTLGHTAVIISPECLHVDPKLFSGAIAQLIEHSGKASPEWHVDSTLIVHGPHAEAAVEEIHSRLYQNYLGRNPMFHAGSVDLESNITVEEFRQVIERSADPINPDTKLIRVPYFFGEEFLVLDMKKFYQDLLSIHHRIGAGQSLVFSPKLLYKMYCTAFSNLAAGITTL